MENTTPPKQKAKPNVVATKRKLHWVSKNWVKSQKNKKGDFCVGKIYST